MHRSIGISSEPRQSTSLRPRKQPTRPALEALEPRTLVAQTHNVTSMLPLGEIHDPFERIQPGLEHAVDATRFTPNELAMTGSFREPPDSTTRVAWTLRDPANSVIDPIGRTGPGSNRLSFGTSTLDAPDSRPMSQRYQAAVFAAGGRFASGDSRFDGQSMVNTGGRYAVAGSDTADDRTLLPVATVTTNTPGLSVRNLTVDAASPFPLSGGSVLQARGVIDVTADAMPLVQRANASAGMNDAWAVGKIQAIFPRIEPGPTIGTEGQGYTKRMGPGGDGNGGDSNSVSRSSSAAAPPQGDVRISVLAPQEHQVVQRHDDNFGVIPVDVEVPGGADRVDARALRNVDGVPVTDWMTIGSGTQIRGGVRILAGWYRIQVRAREAGLASVSEIDAVGVGEVYVTAGQSNMSNSGSVREVAQPMVSAWNGSGWRIANDPQPISGGSKGSIMPILGNLLAMKLKVPIGFISVAVGGTTAKDWLPGGKLYSRIQMAVNTQGPHGIRAILWHQGESDATDSTPSNVYRDEMKAIIKQSRTDAGFKVPWVIATASWSSWVTPAQQLLTQKGQKSLINPSALVFQGPTTDDLGQTYRRPEWNNGRWVYVHMNGAGQRVHATRWANVLYANPKLSGPR